MSSLAEEQRSRGAEEQAKAKGQADYQMSRGAEEQSIRGPKDQRRRRVEE